MVNMDKQHNEIQTNTGITGIQGNRNTITNNDVEAAKELMTPIVSLMVKKDEQFSEVINVQREVVALLKAKDEQISELTNTQKEMIEILKSKDEQINRLIGLVEIHRQQ